ncbi:hypothetical protein F503_00552 [Ophiostoma piceae UAMH 11346]|uniref:Uncharacterized protein n=1 Tax=Ophiostoma piceae (strain UAMH 11346) TaxID=1262450 RepID=S3D3C9_OPHP1|nr:hypothetical protein F503_00552 [Ophiostoma piceae UAMH 11346]
MISVGSWPLTGETTRLIDPRWSPITCFLAVLLCITIHDSLYTWCLHAVKLVIKAMRAPCPIELGTEPTALVVPLHDGHRRNQLDDSSAASKSSRGSAASQLDANQRLHNFHLVGLKTVEANGSARGSESQSAISLDPEDETFIPNRTGHTGRGDFAWNLDLNEYNGRA